MVIELSIGNLVQNATIKVGINYDLYVYCVVKQAPPTTMHWILISS